MKERKQGTKTPLVEEDLFDVRNVKVAACRWLNVCGQSYEPAASSSLSLISYFLDAFFSLLFLRLFFSHFSFLAISDFHLLFCSFCNPSWHYLSFSKIFSQLYFMNYPINFRHRTHISISPLLCMIHPIDEIESMIYNFRPKSVAIILEFVTFLLWFDLL